MQTITLPQIEIDNSILLSLKNSADELAYKMKLYTAIVLYQKRQLSLGKSAQLLGMDRLSFIEVLKDEGIAIFDYNDQEMREVVYGAEELSRNIEVIVVSNTTPIITLACVNQIDILKHFFDKVYIPQAVYDEIKSKRAYGHKEIDDNFFEVRNIKDEFAQNILLNDLDLGEAQTIVLAKEMNADIVLIDETIGYNLAKSQQLNVQRTLSFLIASKIKGYIDEVKPLLDEMIYKGRGISDKVYRDVLRLCGE